MSAATVSVPPVCRSGANTARWRSRLAPDRVFEGDVEFRRVARQPGTVGAAVGAAVDDGGGGGGGDLRAVAWGRGARRATRGGVDATRGARRAADVDTEAHRSSPAAPCRPRSASAVISLAAFIGLGVAGRLRRWRRLLFLPVCASFGAALALARVRQCVRGEGAAMRGARSIFYAGFAQFAWSSSLTICSLLQGEIGGPLRAVDFSEVVLARTRREVLPGHFESDVTERGSFHTSPTY